MFTNIRRRDHEFHDESHFIYYISMVNKCAATNCTSPYATGEKKPSFLFPEDEELRKKWIFC